LYVVLDVPNYPRKQIVHAVVMAHIVGNYVVVDVDTTARLVYKELMLHGVPREKIILRYTGETVPTKG
jgi:hypothetical protein